MHLIDKSKEEGFSLVEVVIVVAIIGLLAATTIVLFKPQEIFANGRNAKRISDVGSLNTAIGQWLSREGAQEVNPYDVLGLLGSGVDAISPGDGDVTGEGVDATTVTEISLPAYIHIIPKDPDGTTEYRIGVNDLSNPLHVIVCTDQIEYTSTYPESKYPNNIFCQSN